MNTWKAILAALVIFTAGTITGALLFGKNQPFSSPESRPVGPNRIGPGSKQRMDFLRRLDKPLNLSDQQRERIEKILSDSQERMKLLWEEVSPRMELELEKSRDSVRQVLSSEQQVTFDEILRMRNQRRPEGPVHHEYRRERPPDRGTNAVREFPPESTGNPASPSSSPKP